MVLSFRLFQFRDTHRHGIVLLLCCAKKILLSPFLSEVQSHSREGAKLDSKKRGCPPPDRSPWSREPNKSGS